LRDYAKRNSRPTKKKSESDGTGILVFLVICTLLFAGYATYHFTHESAAPKIENPTAEIHTPLHKRLIKKITEHKIFQHKVIEHKVVEHKKPVTISKEIKKPAKTETPINPADIQPKYDFYKMLPAMTVAIPKNDAPLPLRSSQSPPK